MASVRTTHLISSQQTPPPPTACVCPAACPFDARACNLPPPVHSILDTVTAQPSAVQRVHACIEWVARRLFFFSSLYTSHILHRQFDTEHLVENHGLRGELAAIPTTRPSGLSGRGPMHPEAKGAGFHGSEYTTPCYRPFIPQYRSTPPIENLLQDSIWSRRRSLPFNLQVGYATFSWCGKR